MYVLQDFLFKIGSISRLYNGIHSNGRYDTW